MNSTRPSKTILVLGIAAAGFFLTPTLSHAKNTPEAIAILTAAGSSNPKTDQLSSLSDSALITATQSVVASPGKLKVGNIIGEALKAGGDSAAFGDQLAAAFPTVSDTDLGLAALRASTGAGANPAFIPDFSETYLTASTVAGVAKVAKKSSTAVGALYGGQSQNADPTTTAQAGIGAYPSAVQQIAQFAGAEAPDAGDFAEDVATTKTLVKVAVGTSTGQPQAAGDVVSTLAANPTLASTVQKSAVSLASGVSKVSDLEQVQKVADTLGSIVTKGQVNGVAKGLAKGIAGRASTTSGQNANLNKGDEFGEVAAYYIGSLVTNPALASNFTSAANAKKAAALIVGAAKSLFKSAKVSKKLGYATPTELQSLLMTKDGFFGASVAFTLKQLGAASLIDANVLLAINDALKTKAKTIVGKTNAATFTTQVNNGIAGTVASGYEDGSLAPDAITDPETDIRNG